ncbi:MAG: ABC transporter permease [Tissierellia bacterium]|nr:ABC transporter permease [Tissierellia bacterium]
MLSIVKLRLLSLRDNYIVFLIMTAMALGFTAIFGISFNSYRPSVIIVDEDNTIYSKEFIEELKLNKTFKFIDSDKETSTLRVEEGDAFVALIVNEGFHDSIENGNEVTIGQIKVKDDTFLLSLQETVRGIITKMAGSERISKVTADFVSSQKPSADKEKIKTSAYINVMDSRKFKNPLKITSTVANTNIQSGYGGMKQSMIGFSVFFSMYTMVFSIGTILSDKRYKTWDRMLTSPVSMSSILGGTMVVSFLVGIMQMSVLILGGKYLFGIDWGSSIAGIMTVTTVFVFTITSLGLMLSGIVKTEAQLGAIAPVVLTSTSMLGGTMWPLEIVNNKILLFLAELTPQKWVMQGMLNIASKGMGFESIIMPSIVLLAMGIIFFTIGVKMVKG